MLGKQYTTNISHLCQAGLLPPCLTSGIPATGTSKKILHRKNKQQRLLAQINASPESLWKLHDGSACLPNTRTLPNCTTYQNKMCPSGLALDHPAASVLKQYSKMGCPTMTGADWTLDQIHEAAHCGPHTSALTPNTIAHFREEATLKAACGQARLIQWKDIRNNPPKQ
jgi:hypothetical protein